MVTALWILAVLMMIVGVVGTVLPALPGVMLVYGGIVLAAYAEGFTRISGLTVAVLGALALVAFVIDYVASAAAAKKAGASKLGLAGAALGTVLGIFTGFIGLLFMPLVGAAIGEYLAQRDALKAGRIGLATWVGLLVGTVLKLAIVFTMIGVFVVAIVL
ncbi:MAG: DUF456 domain-containing protein [Betaproteobacteria bacterium]|jgi:uncharacterized protein YqgC (DUF456 family)|nr:DUF456 domain-containing protein [Burkholderiales bacterium]MCA3221029.1 DUF456 domain-containing protein [Burkholderiales bacterium]MCA3227703.1 DUF456 domain-containing protein [Burkholderiales bacterium]